MKYRKVLTRRFIKAHYTETNEFIPGKMSDFDKPGNFVSYGIDSVEINNGSLTYTAAIIEYEDGLVDLLPVTNIKFVD